MGNASGLNDWSEAGGVQGDASSQTRFEKRALDTGTAHGSSGGGSLLVILAGGGKQEAGMAVSFPVLAEQEQGLHGQGQDAIAGAFAAMDVEHEARAIDIASFQMQGLMQAQPATVDGGEIDLVVKGVGGLEDSVHLGSA
jgi:hypothetical protein